jgi:hypothetical protein
VQLVSEQYLFGGTIDAPSVDKTARSSCSTGRRPTASIRAKLQLAAYEQLWNENSPDMKIQRRGIVRIGKESPDDFEHRLDVQQRAGWEGLQGALISTTPGCATRLPPK